VILKTISRNIHPWPKCIRRRASNSNLDDALEFFPKWSMPGTVIAPEKLRAEPDPDKND
jgi:hypothetical protein